MFSLCGIDSFDLGVCNFAHHRHEVDNDIELLERGFWGTIALGKKDLVAEMIESGGFDVNEVREEWNDTPLHIASSRVSPPP